PSQSPRHGNAADLCRGGGGEILAVSGIWRFAASPKAMRAKRRRNAIAGGSNPATVLWFSKSRGGAPIPVSGEPRGVRQDECCSKPSSKARRAQTYQVGVQGMSENSRGQVDCDLHPSVPGINALLPYPPGHWAEAAVTQGFNDLESYMYPTNAPLTGRADW